MRYLLLFGWIVVLVFVSLTLISAFFKKTSPKRQADKGADMVFDEICRVYIPRERALVIKKEGKEYYFCSTACRGKFLSRAGEYGNP